MLGTSAYFPIEVTAMNRLLPLALAATVLSATTAVTAAATPGAAQLMNANGCSTCHADKVKVIGPAWGWISFHFQGQKDAAETIADFIINGGVGYWKPWTGDIPMPSHPNLSKDDARTIADWILSQPPVEPPKP